MTNGYIVESYLGAMELSLDRETNKNLLFFGGNVTMFESRRRANRAIDVTLADRPTFQKNFGTLQIRRLVDEPPKPAKKRKPSGKQ